MDGQSHDNTGIGTSVEKLINRYLLAHVGGSVPSGLYHRVLKEVEDALFKVVMQHVSNNQVKAAKILGINRNTLRKKLACETEPKKS